MKKLLTFFLLILGVSQGLGVVELPPAFQLFDETVQVLSTRYANPRGINLTSFFTPYRTEIEKACSGNIECPYKIAESSIRKMLDSVDDFHLDYRSDTMPQRRRWVGSRFKNAYFGIRVAVDAERVVVFFVERYSSAAREGIQVGDSIVALGKVTTPDQIVLKLIEFEENASAVTIKLVHLNGKRFEARITPLELNPAKPFLDFDGSIAILTIPSFKVSNTDSIFYPALQGLQNLLSEAKQKGATSLILDLRGNDGGSRYYALNLACSIVPVTRVYREPNNGLVTSINCRNAGDTSVKYSDEPNNNDYHFSVDRPATWDKPIVILTSRMTASAAENITDVLQSAHKAVVIGEPTQGGLGTGGDGRIQLMNDAIFWYSDSVSTDENGVRRAARITPDIYVKLDPEIFLRGRDPFMEAAFKYLEKR